MGRDTLTATSSALQRSTREGLEIAGSGCHTARIEHPLQDVVGHCGRPVCRDAAAAANRLLEVHVRLYIRRQAFLSHVTRNAWPA